MLVACGTTGPRDVTMTAAVPSPTVTAAPVTATVAPAPPSPTPSETDGSTSATHTATPPPTGDTGIDGIVTIGPTCPVERADSPCPDRPYEARVTIWRNQTMIAEARSGVDGRFTMLLAAGTYRIVGESVSPFPHGAEVTVTVVEGHLTPAQIRFDSGIR